MSGTANGGRSASTTTYTWRSRNQRARIDSPTITASFKYDAMGRRTEKTINGSSTGFLYDGSQAIAELRANAIDSVYHTGLQIDEVLARYAASGNRTMLTDALGSVIAQANDGGAIENYYSYTPYGETITLGPDNTNNSIQYTGRENDQTGLYYYRARYYDPVLKRFISEDPIGLEGGINTYSYVGGNPVSYTDPDGQNPVAAARIAWGIGTRTGEAAYPFIAPYLAAAIDAVLLPDPLLAAQGNQVDTGIASVVLRS